MNCSKDQCSQCDLGVILKDFVGPIMQLLTNDIKEYSMGNLTTKCLNTAVMLMYFMLGDEGIKIADACDCTTFNEKSKHYIETTNDRTQNQKKVQDLKKEVLSWPSSQNNHRELYYILLTDANFLLDDNRGVYFPGHVMILEKVQVKTAKSVKRYYNLYQSYINEYDLKGHYQYNGNSFNVTRSRMNVFIDNLVTVMTTNKWNTETVQAWKDITSIDSSYLVGANCGNNFFICWRKVEPKFCLRNIQEYTEAKLKVLKQLPKSPNANSAPYGNASLYRTQQYLNNLQMRTELEKLHSTIRTYL